jgi:alpha-glucuronidase
MQTGKDINNLAITENPYFSYRVLDHWYNHYGGSVAETDRLYSGNRVFKMENFGKLTDEERARIVNYCRMAVFLGLNGMCPDNVGTYQSGSNGNYTCLEASNLKDERIFADIIGTYGLKYYLSVSCASPRIVTPRIKSADAYRNDTVKQWWFDKVDTVRAYIRNFGGFLWKADAEGEANPRAEYDEIQSQAANPVASALGRYGYILILRSFIYGTSDPDFAVNLSKEFQSPPQTWDSAVVLRSKDGPRDFQTIEPPNQLIAIPGVRHGMEFQITQEYTGQGIHLCWLVPRWKKILDWDIKGASTWNGAQGTAACELIQGAGSRTGGVWGVSNLGDTVNWTGQFLAQANYYGYGRLAWNPHLSADQIADEWIRCSVDNGYNYGVRYILKRLLLGSWQAYTDYTIGHSALMPALGNNNHYPIDFNGMRGINFYNDWYMDFPLPPKATGIGVERCNDSSTGTVKNDFARKYLPAALADTFCDLAKCPEEYILFFHHLPWEYRMKGGMTLIQQLQFEHFRGVHEVRRFLKYWNQLNTSAFAAPLMDDGIYSHVLARLRKQLFDGAAWANTFRTQFGACYQTQVPCNISILTPDTSRAAEAAVGAQVTLSAALSSQNGTASTDGTFRWSVLEPGASLSAATGPTTVFTATSSGIYTVKVCDSRWPNQFEDELIFVGDWANHPATGAKTGAAAQSLPSSLSIKQRHRHVMIRSPFAGKFSVISLQGRVVKSAADDKAATFIWDVTGAAKGLYVVQVRNDTRTLRSKLFVR